MDRFTAMPKTELHVHLDGSLRPTTALELANEEELLPGKELAFWEDALRAPERCLDLNDYLRRFDLPLQLLQTEGALRRVARELIEDMAAETVIYAEIRFAPQLHTKKGLSQRQAVLAVAAGCREAGLFPAGILLCCMRGAPDDLNRETLQTAALLRDKGVCGVDLAGAEALYPTEGYRSLFHLAKELTLPFTIHAGEAAGPESVRAAVSMGARRIGHGLRAVQDPSLLELLREKQILLECCPISNIQTQAAASLAEHPFPLLYRAGIPLSINTDNRTVSSTSLTREYTVLHSAFSLPDRVFLQCNRNALQAAFLPEAERRTLLRQLETTFPLDFLGEKR